MAGLKHKSFHKRYFFEGRGKPPLISERWTEDRTGRPLAYAFAYIDFAIHTGDNGRVLGYDNAHGFHERHFMGRASATGFSTYDAQYERFLDEVTEIRSKHGEHELQVGSV
jgi:hypothetical protein